MQLRFLAVITAFFATIRLTATFLPAAMGPQSGATGGVSFVRRDPYAAFNHPGALGMAEQPVIAFAFQSRFFVEGLNYYGLACHREHSGLGIFGMGFGYFGNKYFNESLLKCSWSRKLNKDLSLGVAMDYFRMQASGNGPNVLHKVFPEAGIYGRWGPRLDYSLRVVNPFRVKIKNYQEERLELLVSPGFCYKPSESLRFYLEYENRFTQGGQWNFGGQYRKTDQWAFLVGLRGRPVQPSFGIQFLNKGIHIALSVSMHPLLKQSSGLGIIRFYNQEKA